MPKPEPPAITLACKGCNGVVTLSLTRKIERAGVWMGACSCGGRYSHQEMLVANRRAV